MQDTRRFARRVSGPRMPRSSPSESPACHPRRSPLSASFSSRMCRTTGRSARPAKLKLCLQPFALRLRSFLSSPRNSPGQSRRWRRPSRVRRGAAIRGAPPPPTDGSRSDEIRRPQRSRCGSRPRRWLDGPRRDSGRDQDSVDARCSRTFQDRFAIRIEDLHVQMAMRVDECQVTCRFPRSPHWGIAASGGRRSSGRPAGSPAPGLRVSFRSRRG